MQVFGLLFPEPHRSCRPKMWSMTSGSLPSSVSLHLFSIFSTCCYLCSLCSPSLFPPLVVYNRLTVVVSWRGAHSTVNLPGPRNPGPLSHVSPPATWRLRFSAWLKKVSLLLCLIPSLKPGDFLFQARWNHRSYWNYCQLHFVERLTLKYFRLAV